MGNLGAQKEKRNDEYNKYVKRVTPTHCLSANMLKAFILGGIICTIGQLIVNTCTQYFGLSSDEASAWCSMILILISCILTALNLYAPLANWGGAGALVPITGFANGVCSSACEFQVEGQVFGIGCQIFRIVVSKRRIYDSYIRKDVCMFHRIFDFIFIQY